MQALALQCSMQKEQTPVIQGIPPKPSLGCPALKTKDCFVQPLPSLISRQEDFKKSYSTTEGKYGEVGHKGGTAEEIP